MRNSYRLVLIAMAAVALSCEVSSAAQIAYDSAGDSVYNGYGPSDPLPTGAPGFPIGVNGGYGWGGGSHLCSQSRQRFTSATIRISRNIAPKMLPRMIAARTRSGIPTRVR